jgi:hypothetical protein
MQLTIKSSTNAINDQNKEYESRKAQHCDGDHFALHLDRLVRILVSITAIGGFLVT